MTAEAILKPNSLRARLSDALNPIVVKELRQAVQSRFVAAALMALLAIQLTAIALYLLTVRAVIEDFDAGRQVFMLLLGILLGACLLFVPIYTAVRLVAERSDTHVDLLFVTTIHPRSIVAGKMMAAAVLSVLIFSACMPFMTFTYFLRGIDLPTIFVLLALSFLVVIACTQLAVFIACLPVNRVFKTLFGLGGLVIFVIVFVAVMSSATSIVIFGAGSSLVSWDFWGPACAIMLISFALIGLLFALSVALIMPLAANRALLVRGYITAVWLLTGVAAAIWSWAEKFQPPVIVWHIISNSVFAIAIFVAVSERDRAGRRVLRTIPQHWLKRQLAFLYYSGAASGLAWSCVMIGLTLNAAWVWVSLTASFKEAHDLTESLKWIGGMCLYFYCYALSAASLRRHLFVWLGTELTWLLGVTLMALGSILPFLWGYLFLFSDQWWSKDIGVWLVGNPFAFSNDTHRELYVTVGGLWAALVTALNLHWFIARVRSFHPAANNAEPEEIIELGLS